MTKKQNNAYHRLPVTFHQTFIPERAHISALLKFAASGNESTSTPLSVTDQEISVETGIPTGQSSGKVPAMLDYCRGMNLMTVEKGTQSGHKRPVLTDFGRTVLLEDSNISEELSQWMAHLFLCRRHGGAEIWHLSFAVSYDVLGMECWDVHFPEERQMTLTDFEEETYFQRMCGWNERQYHTILEFLQDSGAIDMDKQIRPWVLSRRAESTSFWRRLYDELA